MCFTTTLQGLPPQPILSRNANRLGSMLGMDSSGSAASSACGQVLEPLLPPVASAPAVHRALGSPRGAQPGVKLSPLRGAELLVGFTASLLPVPLVHAGGANLLSLSHPGIHMKTTSSTSRHAAWTGATQGTEGGIRESCSLSIFTPTPGLAFEPTERKAGARLAASW